MLIHVRSGLKRGLRCRGINGRNWIHFKNQKPLQKREPKNSQTLRHGKEEGITVAVIETWGACRTKHPGTEQRDRQTHRHRHSHTGVMGNRWKQSEGQADQWHMRVGRVTWNERAVKFKNKTGSHETGQERHDVSLHCDNMVSYRKIWLYMGWTELNTSWMIDVQRIMNMDFSKIGIWSIIKMPLVMFLYCSVVFKNVLYF